MSKPVKDADVSVRKPTALAAGRWQFSLLEMMAFITSLPLAMGSLWALLESRHVVPGLLYASMSSVGIGLAVGSAVGHLRRAILGAISGAMAAVPFMVVFMTNTHDPGIACLFAVLITATPGAFAALGSIERGLKCWLVLCACVAGAEVVIGTTWPVVIGRVYSPEHLIQILKQLVPLVLISMAVLLIPGVISMAIGRVAVILYEALMRSFAARRQRISDNEETDQGRSDGAP